jgi:hypothetical protein
LNIRLSHLFTSQKRQGALVVLLATTHPEPGLLEILAGYPAVNIVEAFTTQGALRNLAGANLVLRGDLLPLAGVTEEVLARALEASGLPVVPTRIFMKQPEEWLSRARLASARPVTILPARQVNLANWAGGVGKTTLALALCKRFVERSGLPAALLELGMGGCALHARVAADATEFFAIATQGAAPARWHGVSLYPMDGRTAQVMWSEEPERVLAVIAQIRKQHTLLVVDAYPGHALFDALVAAPAEQRHLAVATPRDDALLQARRLSEELGQESRLVLNMARSLADRAGAQAAAVLPYKESWAGAYDRRLADPLLELVYPGWLRRMA